MFTYGEVESALAQLHRADTRAQEGAFRGWLKHFQKLGVPLGLNPGKGRKIKYGLAEVYQFAFCLELAEFGMDPTTIVSILQKRWNPSSCSEKEESILRNFELAAEAKYPGSGHDVYLCVSPWVRAQAWSDQLRPDLNFRWFAEDDAELVGIFLSSMFGDQRRACLINVSDVLRDLHAALPQEPA